VRNPSDFIRSKCGAHGPLRQPRAARPASVSRARPDDPEKNLAMNQHNCSKNRRIHVEPRGTSFIRLNRERPG